MNDVQKTSVSLPFLGELQNVDDGHGRGPRTNCHINSHATTAFSGGGGGETTWTSTAERSLEAWRELMVAEISPRLCSWVNGPSRNGLAWTRFDEGGTAKR